MINSATKGDEAMHNRRDRLLTFVGCVLSGLLLAHAPRVEAADRGPQIAGAFDDYVLALTWVPGFCVWQPAKAECGRGLGFALHGLWPKFENGDYPSNCGPGRLAPRDRAAFSGLYPDPSMIDHEWSKHGTCSGLTPAAYAATARTFQAGIQIPTAFRSPRVLDGLDAVSLRASLIAANPGLDPADLQIIRSRGAVTEVRVCLSRQGQFRPCARP